MDNNSLVYFSTYFGILPNQLFTILILLMIWEFFWKGKALWKAAQKKDLYWFVALLIINTLGILPLLYIYFFSKKK